MLISVSRRGKEEGQKYWLFRRQFTAIKVYIQSVEIKLVLSNNEAEKRNSRGKIRRKRTTFESKLTAEVE